MAFRRPRRAGSRSPEPLSTLLSRASPDQAAKKAQPLPPQAWVEAVGVRIAQRTRPVALDRGILTVRAATAVWAQELTFLAPTIQKRLVARGFAIEGLRFRVGAIENLPRPEKPPPVKKVPAQKPLPVELARRIASIDDVDLRGAIARAASANLAWQAAAEAPVNAARPAARAPRSAARGNAPQDRTPTTPPGAASRKL
jgi:hypothetical protein